MTKEELRRLLAWDDWAFGRLLATAVETSPAELEDELGPEGGIRDILAHAVGGSLLWLARWEGGGRSAPPIHTREARASAYPDLAAVRAAAETLAGARDAWLAARSEADLAADFRWRDSQGLDWVAPLWITCVHAVTHATQHRAEAALLLTRLGHSPGDLDLVYRERRPAG